MTIHFRVANRDTHARYPFAAKAAPLQLGQTLQHDHLLVALHVAAGKPCANASEWTQAITKPCKALTRAAQTATLRLPRATSTAMRCPDRGERLGSGARTDRKSTRLNSSHIPLSRM